MTLASDPFGLIASAAQQARPTVAVRDLWRGFQRVCTIMRREADRPLPMAESSWQAGFAAMWDQEGEVEDKAGTPPANRGGMEFL